MPSRERCGQWSGIRDVRLIQSGLYLLAFGPLRDAFTVRELRGFVDIMAERGLRVRRGLEEYGWDAEGAREESEDEDGDEDER